MSTSTRQLLVQMACVAAGALGFYWLIGGAQRIHEALTQTPWDFQVDWSLARAYVEGYNPYTPEGAHRAGLDHMVSQLGHPPSTAFWALPFTGMDLKAATFALALLCTSLLAFQLVVTVRELEAKAPLVIAWLGFTFVVSSEFFAYHLRVGQISEVIGFCLFLAWLGIRREDEWLSGLALGVACSLKPFPGVVVLLFLLYKRYRAVATAISVFAIASLVMTARYGWASWPLFLDKQRAVADVWMDNIQNHSLHGIVAHLFRPTCEPHGPVIRAAALTSSALSVILVGAALWVAYRMPRSRANAELLFAAFAPLAIFTSQWAWEHYYVILVMPFAIATDRLRAAWKSGANRLYVSGGVAALAGALYAARIPVLLKQSLQRSVQRGNSAAHVRLHVYEALSSAPLVLVLIVTWTLVIAELRRRSAADAPSAATPDTPVPG